MEVENVWFACDVTIILSIPSKKKKKVILHILYDSFNKI